MQLELVCVLVNVVRNNAKVVTFGYMLAASVLCTRESSESQPRIDLMDIIFKDSIPILLPSIW